MEQFTFITEDIPPAKNFVQSGKGLRLSYAARQEAKLITDMLIEEEDPNRITKEEWTDFRAIWKREAEIKYPDEGDYRVWLIDPITEEPVLIGEVVEFMGGDVRNNVGILPCREYSLDLSGVIIPDPTTFIIGVSYTNCRIERIKVSDTAENIDRLTICVGQGYPPVTSTGVFNDMGPCEIIIDDEEDEIL